MNIELELRFTYAYLQLVTRLQSQRNVLLLGTLLLFCQDILHLQRLGNAQTYHVLDV